ncbi:MAG: hypothetical protein H6825_00260 [Planctomycetes bacterium]|nr:hypothetical protein [Planctomycetota bacterium]
MPSDDVDVRILRRLRRSTDRFRSALALAAEQVRGMLGPLPDASEVAPDARPLGRFAAGRIDPSAFARLVTRAPRDDAPDQDLLLAAFHTITSLLERGDAAQVVRVDRGADLRDAVGRALTDLGRAFAAARLVAPSTKPAERDPSLLQALPFARWNAAERELAPPLVVHVDGADLQADGLAEFLDGSLLVVLLVREAAPPAALVRLVTPGTYVLQSDAEDDLDAFARHTGPGIAAIVPGECARFVHDPRGGAGLGDRLVLRHLPDAPPRTALGARSARQQAEELLQLAVLAQEPPAALAAAGAHGTSADPIDVLASWLLGRAGLGKLEVDA